MARKKSNNLPPEGGSLTEELAVSLNKKFSKEYNQVAYFLNGGDESPTDVTSWDLYTDSGCASYFFSGGDGGFYRVDITEATLDITAVRISAQNDIFFDWTGTASLGDTLSNQLTSCFNTGTGKIVYATGGTVVVDVP
mgnify:CR=1 FL=1